MPVANKGFAIYRLVNQSLLNTRFILNDQTIVRCLLLNNYHLAVAEYLNYGHLPGKVCAI